MKRLLYVIVICTCFGCNNSDVKYRCAYVAFHKETFEDFFSGKQFPCMVKDTFYAIDNANSSLIHKRWIKDMDSPSEWQQSHDPFQTYYTLPADHLFPPLVVPGMVIYQMSYAKDSSYIYSGNFPGIKFKRL